MGNLHVRGPRVWLVRYRLRRLDEKIEEIALRLIFLRFCAKRQDTEPLLERLAWARDHIRRALLFDTGILLEWCLQKELAVYYEVLEAHNQVVDLHNQDVAQHVLQEPGVPPHHRA